MLLFAVHAALALLLLAVVQWISRHSGWWGYRQIALVEEPSQAPAHNAVYRVLAPVVFLTVTAAGWYALGLDWVVRDYYLVAVYYAAARALLVLALGQRRLVRWGRQLLLAGASAGLSYLLYAKVLRFRHNLLPDPANLANELWIVIILFLYQTFNRVEWSPGPGAEARTRDYVSARFRALRARYGRVVEQEVGDPAVRVLVYAVMIHESFNRPPVYQWLESHVLARFRRVTSLGPMQVQSTERIGDEESVRRGARLLAEAHAAAAREVAAQQAAGAYVEAELPAAAANTPASADAPAPSDAVTADLRALVVGQALQRYNVRSDYPRAVRQVYATLLLEHFPELVASELPEYERSPL